MAELATFTHVGQRQVERGLHDADRSAREHQPLGVEATHQDPHAPVGLTQHVVIGDQAVVEDQFARARSSHPELLELGRRREPLHTALDDERRDARRASLDGVGGPQVDEQHVRVRSVRDPHLRAVRTPAAVDALGTTAHRPEHVRAGVGLAHRERPDLLARDQSREPSRALLGGGVQPQVVHAQVRVRGVRQADGRGTARELLDARRDARGTSGRRRRRTRQRSARGHPGLASFGQSHRGNVSSRSIASACGAISRLDEPADRPSELLDRDALGTHSTPIRRRSIPITGIGYACEDLTVRLHGPDEPGRIAAGSGAPCPDFAPTSIAGSEAFAANAEAMRELVEDLRGRLESGADRRWRVRDRASPRARQAARARTDRRAPRPRCGVPRVFAARRDGSVRRRGAVGGHRHRYRSDPRPTLCDRGERRDGEGRHVLPGHGEEAPARAGDRDGEPSAVHLPGRLGRRVSCRCRPTSSPTATTSGASSTTRPGCPPPASRRSPR